MPHLLGDKIKVLAVDDEIMNIDVLEEHLKEADFHVLIARDGVEAMECLQQNPDVKVIILDRMMPRMDGMEVIRLTKQDPALKDIPIIMQTAAASSAQILEGLQANIYYYLTKPYSIFKLVSIVRSALQSKKAQQKLKEDMRALTGLDTTHQHHLHTDFRTPEDARNLACRLARLCPDPERVVIAIYELLVNAIEHGNLGINYGEKKLLMVADTWETEIQERLNKEENRTKHASVSFEKMDHMITITIKDAGKGFSWQTYLSVIPARMGEPHGRGILAAIEAFDGKVEFKETGNVVTCTIPL